MHSEEDLVRACAAGEPAAWRRFVDLYSTWILRVARLTLGRRGGPALEAEAEDVAAEIFRGLVERDHALLKSFRAPFNLKAWLAVLTRRACHRLSRKSRRTVRASEPLTSPPRNDGLDDLLARLPAEDRVLLQLFFVHDASYEEIAAALGVSVETVGKQKFRALERLREIARRAGREDLP